MRKTIPLLVLAPLFGLFFQGCTPTPEIDCWGNEIIDTKYVHKYGMAMPMDDWQHSGQSGQVVKTLKQGVVCSQAYYDGQLEGETTYTFPFSDDLEKVQYYSSNRLNKETIYHRNGTPRQETDFSENDRVVREWYETGTLKSVETSTGERLVKGDYYDVRQQHTSNIENGSGVKTVTDSYGQLISTEHYNDGQMTHITRYHPNGSPKEITPFQNGVVEGYRKTFYPGGEPMTIESWLGGRQEGLTTVYQDGVKVEEVPFVNGMKNGKARVFKDGTSVSQEISWKDDQKHGPTHTYIDDRIATDWYLRGNKVSKGYYDALNLNRQ